MLATAITLPANFVPVPSVAELPTCQNTLHTRPPLITTTEEPTAVVSVLPIWNSAAWFLKALATQGLLPILIDQTEIVVQMAVALVNLVTELSLALSEWFQSFFCVGQACLQPERGVLNLFPGMLAAREFR
jgi:hypothetical protein